MTRALPSSESMPPLPQPAVGRPSGPTRRGLLRARGASGLLVAAALWLGGCCLHRRGYEPPSPATLRQAAWPSEGARVRSLRARAKLDQFTDKGRVKVRVFLLAARGGRLRLEAVSPLDTTLVTLTSDGRRFASIDHRAGRVITGPATACAIAKVLGVSLRPDEVLGVLTGQVPLLGSPARVSVRWDRCKAMERLTLTGAAGRTQRVWLRRVGRRFRPERSEVRDARGKLLLAIQFDRYRRVGGRQVPGRIRIQRPAGNTDVIVRFDKLALDVPVPEEAFHLTVPPGLPEGVLDCAEAPGPPVGGPEAPRRARPRPEPAGPPAPAPERKGAPSPKP